MKFSYVFKLVLLLLFLPSLVFAGLDKNSNSAAFFDKVYYPKIPWTFTHKKEFDQILSHNIDTPYTRLDRSRSALLIIDTQNDWGDPKGSAPESDIEAIMPNIKKAINIWRKSQLPIIHVVRMYYKDGSNADMSRKWQMQNNIFHMAVPGSWGSQLVEGTAPKGTILDYKTLLNLGVQKIGKNEYVIYKPHYNGFDRSVLNALLQSLNVNSVVFIGMTFPNCIRATQYGATDHHYRVAAVPVAMTQVFKGGLVAMMRQGVQLWSMKEFKEFVLDNRKKQPPMAYPQ